MTGPVGFVSAAMARATGAGWLCIISSFFLMVGRMTLIIWNSYVVNAIPSDMESGR
jgi:hypothetical protein